MRALYLTAKPPLPLESGAAIRDWNLITGLLEDGHEVDLMTLDGNRTVTSTDASAMRQAVSNLTVLPLSLASFSSRSSRVMAVAGRPLHGFVDRVALVRRQIHTALNAGDYEVVVASQLFMAPAIPDEWLARTIYDSHNVESERYRRLLTTNQSLAHRAVAHTLPRQIERLESRFVRAVGATVACSERDAIALTRIGGGARVDVVANGVGIRPLPERTPGQVGRVLFLASLDYTPNVAALQVFVDEIVPLLPKGGIQVVVAGSQPTRSAQQLMAAHPDIEFLPNVPDAAALMRGSDILVVPLRAGGGTRLKVLEAFACGVPVVSTALGVEGLNITSGRHAVVDDTVEGMADGITRLLANRAMWSGIREEAYEFAAAKYDWKNVCVGFNAVAERVAAGRTTRERVWAAPSLMK